jgi:hypothetical protein
VEVAAVPPGVSTREELRAGLETQAILGGKIGTNLLELGIVDEAQLAAALTKAHGLPCIPLRRRRPRRHRP